VAVAEEAAMDLLLLQNPLVRIALGLGLELAVKVAEALLQLAANVDVGQLKAASATTSRVAGVIAALR
jgi:hypothetical protein